MRMYQKKRSEGDSQDRAFVFTARDTYVVRIPAGRIFICRNQPAYVRTVAEIVKRFIAEASNRSLP